MVISNLIFLRLFQTVETLNITTALGTLAVLVIKLNNNFSYRPAHKFREDFDE